MPAKSVKMMWTPLMRDFIQQHLDDDTAALLMAARKYPGIDVPFAVEQIEARRRLKNKLPEWCGNAELIMGGRVPAEQCSSEVTARYKRSIVGGRSLCDMTGGMGVDFWYMCEGMERAIYTERDGTLLEAARHNFGVLRDGRHPEVEVRRGDGQVLPVPSVDVIYLDPARRAGDGSRVYAMEDCEPNIVGWQEELLRHARTVLVKLSPMVDLTDVVRKLRGVTEVHVVAVRNECKEVLVRMERSQAPSRSPKGQAHGLGGSLPAGCVQVHGVDFLASSVLRYAAKFPDEMDVLVTECGVGRYLYEPDVTLMKAQVFGSLCHRFPVRQLDFGTHLMTSDERVPDFPGRIFEVEETMPFSSKLLKRLGRDLPRANIATRNFILSADELRRRTGVRDGGDLYLFGVKVKDFGELLLKCRKISVSLHP
ncbi:MAG: SAM-dependent methyltransferase [Bacteroidaceae bacterium]|nr:SAM-dependent methyltransferase [Bacteroidaceae bacterium]